MRLFLFAMVVASLAQSEVWASKNTPQLSRSEIHQLSSGTSLPLFCSVSSLQQAFTAAFPGDIVGATLPTPLTSFKTILEDALVSREFTVEGILNIVRGKVITRIGEFNIGKLAISVIPSAALSLIDVLDFIKQAMIALNVGSPIGSTNADYITALNKLVLDTTSVAANELLAALDSARDANVYSIFQLTQRDRKKLRYKLEKILYGLKKKVNELVHNLVRLLKTKLSTEKQVFLRAATLFQTYVGTVTASADQQKGYIELNKHIKHIFAQAAKDFDWVSDFLCDVVYDLASQLEKDINKVIIKKIGSDIEALATNTECPIA